MTNSPFLSEYFFQQMSGYDCFMLLVQIGPFVNGTRLKMSAFSLVSIRIPSFSATDLSSTPVYQTNELFSNFMCGMVTNGVKLHVKSYCTLNFVFSVQYRPRTGRQPSGQDKPTLLHMATSLASADITNTDVDRRSQEEEPHKKEIIESVWCSGNFQIRRYFADR